MVQASYYTPDDQLEQTMCGEYCAVYLTFGDFSLHVQKYHKGKRDIVVSSTGAILSLLNISPIITSSFRPKGLPKVKPFQIYYLYPATGKASLKAAVGSKYAFLGYAQHNWAPQTQAIPLGETSIIERC